MRAGLIAGPVQMSAADDLLSQPYSAMDLAAFFAVVRDNGIGFEPHQAEPLFQPFHRLHGAAYEGSGVGLSIVQRAVARHGGRVWALAAARGGASFHFTLPDPPSA
jgi:signal transduction histidine kinase